MRHAYSLSVAKELARLSLSGREPDPLTHLRLQKLLYYAQAWSLVIRDSELFPEIIEGWRFGPVVPAVFNHLPDGRKAGEIDAMHFEGVPELPESEKDFVRCVWEAYKGYSATALADQTHREQPYLNAWKERSSDAEGHDPISIGDLQDYFSDLPLPQAIADFRKVQDEAEANAAEWLANRAPLNKDSLLKKAAIRSLSASA